MLFTASLMFSLQLNGSDCPHRSHCWIEAFDDKRVFIISNVPTIYEFGTFTCDRKWLNADKTVMLQRCVPNE